LPLYRSWFSVFAAAPRSNSNLSLFSINWPFCADNAPVDLRFHPWIGFYGCCSTGSGPRSSTRWYWSSPQPWSRGIARASGSIGAGDHVVRDGPGSVPQIRDLIRRMSNANPLWGAPRIHGEPLKLGIKISQARVAGLAASFEQAQTSPSLSQIGDGSNRACSRCCLGHHHQPSSSWSPNLSFLQTSRHTSRHAPIGSAARQPHTSLQTQILT
jgi:hypothetical protein